MLDARIFVRSARSRSASVWSPRALSKLIPICWPFAVKFGFSRLAGTLALLLGATAALAANAAGVGTRVEEVARQVLVDQARRGGLAEPQIVVSALSSARVPRSCAGPAAQLVVDALDTQHASRLRFVARCASQDWSEPYTVRAEVSAQVLVAAQPIKAGTPLTADDLRLERRVLGAIDEALSDPAAAIGSASRRALRAGQTVDRRVLTEALLVRRGAAVSIVARNAGIVVTMAGQASAAGRRGELIDVRNSATGKHIQARITGLNEVEPAGEVISQPPD
jgi:flagella basal body P-ring formation protein FlgA